jgi:(R,R)-butanediol dehydrogenase/meso-butanediol dehydrogenase/diacetyl reductase
MKAVVFEGAGKPLVVKDVPSPEAEAGQLLVRVRGCGICGSDIHAAQTGFAPEGVLFGHEFSGEVEALGEGVQGDWKVGDRVISLGAMTCGTCDACTAGNITGCKDMRMIGFDPRAQGAYAEYVLAQAALCFKVPDTIPFDDAATVEPLAVGLNAFREAEIRMGEDVLILGAGPIGLAVTKWARFFGVRHIAVSEIVPSRRDRAKAAGASVVIAAEEHADPVAAFQQETGRLPAVIFECIGRPVLQHLFEIAPHRARLVLAGTCMEPEEIKILTGEMKCLKLSLAFGYEPSDFELVLDLLASGRINAEPLISDRIPLDEVPQVFESLQKPNDRCKVIIQP